MSGGPSMTEAASGQRLPSDSFAPGQATTDAVSGGVLLRRAREAAGVHVTALASSLKVPVYKLEALEEGRFDLLTDLVFARALAASVCRTLKIDPNPVLERLPQAGAPHIVRSRDGINAPFRVPGDLVRQSWVDQLSRPAVLAVLALLLGALVLIFLPDAGQDAAIVKARPGSEAPPSAAVSPEPVADPAVPQLVAADSLARSATVPVSATASTDAPASMPLASGAWPIGSASPTAARPILAVAGPEVITPSPVLTRAVTLSSVSPVPAASAAPVAAASGVVVFRSASASWVRVTDAKGTVVLRKTLSAGESAGASGALPLQVTIGTANVTAVQVRGEPFDLAPVSRDNVARFEVR